MRLLGILLLLYGLAGFAGPALSDQNDPRLDELFTRLKQAQGLEQAAAAEKKIWEIWLETPEPEVGARLRAGIEHMNQGNHNAALKAFDDVVEVAPDFAEGWNKRATLHYLMGNYEESLEDIARTLELEPRHFGALSGRGLVYTKLDKLDRALAAYEAALEVHPQMPGPRVNAKAIRKILNQREI